MIESNIRFGWGGVFMYVYNYVCVWGESMKLALNCFWGYGGDDEHMFPAVSEA